MGCAGPGVGTEPGAHRVHVYPCAWWGDAEGICDLVRRHAVWVQGEVCQQFGVERLALGHRLGVAVCSAAYRTENVDARQRALRVEPARHILIEVGVVPLHEDPRLFGDAGGQQFNILVRRRCDFGIVAG